MSKKGFVEEYAKLTGETKKRSEELVNAFLETVENLVVKGEDVQFVGWGIIQSSRKKRKRRN